ncbi:MAG: glycosyltransferase, partial [Coleofasciculaceae cyanobacterium SM2_3_26]|nr:glycosyltransferase [Coleofasciculaceae cyanobacterium SM2_3_26]
FGIGRLVDQKDFATLIRAFSIVKKVRKSRLVILGTGPNKPRLEALIEELDLRDDVDLPGFVENPFKYMARASVFVMSSAWEGFGNVLVEAMAVGTPVVSTDCRSGPSEILDNGKYGALVPVGDAEAMARAILDVIAGKQKPVDPAWLDRFRLETVANQYLDLLGIDL